MADTKEISTQVFLIAGGLLLVAALALGFFYLFAPGDQVVALEERDEVEQPREGYEQGLFSGVVTAGERGEVLDSLRGSVVMLDYQYDRQAGEVSGSVLNNTRQPFVNIQIGFRLLDASEQVVGTVADTLGQIGPSATQRFNIVLPVDQAVTSVEPQLLTAQQRNVVGPQADPLYPQND